jgi:uncharacterized NAD-dependent epimerase/dehydratase family protein
MTSVSFEAPPMRPPFLLFLGDVTNPLDAKTALDLARWRPEDCVGQLRFGNCRIDTGLPDMDIGQARRAGARSLVIGVAPVGGALNPDWENTLANALDAGLDLVSGMHTPMTDVPKLANAAYRSGQRLVDVRQPPEGLTVASGRRRTGRRVLTVGTDCCVGKKTTALALHRGLRRAGIAATFRATGQTGIMISGAGIPIDAVPADFVAGAAERLSPDNDPHHWDVIEGQGSLFHPAYAAVTLGLLHGSQPDLLVLCHDPLRRSIDDFPDYPLPTVTDSIDRYTEAARLTNPDVRFAGISLNTAHCTPSERRSLMTRTEEETGLPCFDPLEDGVERLVETVERSMA